MTNTVEIYDPGSPDYAQSVKICGQEVRVIGLKECYDSMYSTYDGDRYPYMRVELTLVRVPPPPPSPAKRTWTNAMGLRRPTR